MAHSTAKRNATYKRKGKKRQKDLESKPSLHTELNKKTLSFLVENKNYIAHALIGSQLCLHQAIFVVYFIKENLYKTLAMLI